MKFVVGLFVVVIGLFLVFGVKKDDVPHSDTTTRPTPAPEIRNDPPTERAPRYEADHDGEDAAVAEYAAMRAVYALCSSQFAFREGSKLRGGFVAGTGKKYPPVVNVGVELYDTSKAGGHTLWYRVGLDKSGKPTSATPQKTVSAEACGIAPGVPTPL